MLPPDERFLVTTFVAVDCELRMVVPGAIARFSRPASSAPTKLARKVTP